MSIQYGPYPNVIPMVVDGELARNDDPALARDMNKAYRAGWQARGKADEQVCRELADKWRTLSGLGYDETRERYGHWEDAAVSLANIVAALKPPASWEAEK